MVRKAKHMEETLLKKRSQMRDIWRRFKSNKLAMVGLVIVVVIVLSAVFADVITPYEYSARSSDRLVFPCLAHPFGTDNYGRDLLSRVIYGGRISLLVSLLGLLISVGIGSVLGATAGYFGGPYETIVMRLMERGFHAPYRDQYHDDLRSVFHRAGCPAPHAGMGVDPQHGPGIHHDLLAYDHLPRHRHHADDVRL